MLIDSQVVAGFRSFTGAAGCETFVANGGFSEGTGVYQDMTLWIDIRRRVLTGQASKWATSCEC